jgi:lysophospholipase L1-like esterase
MYFSGEPQNMTRRIRRRTDCQSVLENSDGLAIRPTGKPRVTVRLFPGRLLAAVLAAAVCSSAVLAQGSRPEPQSKTSQKPQKQNRWESRIRAFEAQDKKQPPPKEGILFVGSSSIVGWDLKKCFPGLPAINRGFGGSQVADSVHFAERIVLPYRPRVIVLYAGDNDVAAGKTPQQVLADYRAFVNKVHAALPKTRIVFVAIKPSLRRWHLVGKMREANRLIRAAAAKDPRLVFVDVDGPMIGADGKPRPELFRKDGLHLNAAGYKLWSDLVRPHLKLD